MVSRLSKCILDQWSSSIWRTVLAVPQTNMPMSMALSMVRSCDSEALAFIRFFNESRDV